jgi:hypothetical protein
MGVSVQETKVVKQQAKVNKIMLTKGDMEQKGSAVQQIDVEVRIGWLEVNREACF